MPASPYMPGQLYLVGTPIGNLGDITLRAVETLKMVERVYAEDTRRSRALLNHLGIHGKKLIALHAHSTDRALDAAVETLNSGEDLALVTDAGMPSISDPGTELVRRARNAGARITVVPGPSAVTSAVAVSGLVDGPFSFFGFLPRKGNKRTEMLQHIERSAIPVILFESPHRVKETLEDLSRSCGARPVAICRELTKKFEEVIASSLDQFGAGQAEREWLGEFTIVVAGKGEEAPEVGEPLDLDQRALGLLKQGHSVRETAQLISQQLAASGHKMSRRDVYTVVLLAGSAEAAQDPGDDAE